MLSKAFAALAAATLTSAATPQGFMPGSNTPLIVSYGGISALDGVNLPKDSSQNQPTIGTEQKLQGQYAVMMIDIDVPTNQPPMTGTFLHWMQTGLMSADTPTVLNTTAGMKNVYLMQNKMNAAALAPYIGPAPPAREPLSHRYTLVAVDHTQISQQGLQALSSAAMTRGNFNPMNALTAAGLQSKVVAGDFFRVTNAGPVGAGQGNSPMMPPAAPSGNPGTGTGNGGSNPGMMPMPMPGSPMPGSPMPGPPMPGSPSGVVPPIGGAQPTMPMRASGQTLQPGLGVMALCLCAVGSLFVSL